MVNQPEDSSNDVIHPNRSRIFGLIALLIVAVAVPLTVFVAQKRQEIRQHAAGPADNTLNMDIGNSTGGSMIHPVTPLTQGQTYGVSITTGCGCFHSPSIDAPPGLSCSGFHMTSQACSDNNLGLGDLDYWSETCTVNAGSEGNYSVSGHGSGRSGSCNTTISYSIRGPTTNVVPTPQPVLCANSQPAAFPKDTAHTLTNALASYWNMDEASGSAVADVGGRHNGTTNAASVTSGCKSGNCRQFIGSTDSFASVDVGNVVSIPDSPQWIISKNPVTISAWVKLNNLTNQQVFVGQLGSFGQGHYQWVWNLEFNHTAGLDFGANYSSYNTSAPNVAQGNLNGWDTTNWHHVAAVSDGQKFTIYLDGAQVGQKDITGDASNLEGPLSIGGLLDDHSTSPPPGAARLTNGLIDEVGFWNRALTGAEIGDLFNSGNADALSCNAPASGSAQLSLNLSLSGIGTNGGTLTPLHPTRNVTVCLYASSADPSGDSNCDKAVLKKPGTVTYDSPSKNFVNAAFDLGTGVNTAAYQVFVKADDFLRKRIPGAQTITVGASNQMPLITLLPGDINNDNKIDLNDYNTLISCFGNKAQTCSNKDASDLNDDGKIDGVDVNLFVISLSVQRGD